MWPWLMSWKFWAQRVAPGPVHQRLGHIHLHATPRQFIPRRDARRPLFGIDRRRHAEGRRAIQREARNRESDGAIRPEARDHPAALSAPAGVECRDQASLRRRAGARFQTSAGKAVHLYRDKPVRALGEVELDEDDAVSGQLGGRAGKRLEPVDFCRGDLVIGASGTIPSDCTGERWV